MTALVRIRVSCGAIVCDGDFQEGAGVREGEMFRIRLLLLLLLLLVLSCRARCLSRIIDDAAARRAPNATCHASAIS